MSTSFLDNSIEATMLNEQTFDATDNANEYLDREHTLDMSHAMHPVSPVLIILMGVSGCGKSTLASYLAQHFGYEFVEADDFHPEVNKHHMASGLPLTDDMREPWIHLLFDHLQKCHHEGKSCVMAFSGLRKLHRQKFRHLGYPTLYLHLRGPKNLIKHRLEKRENHFMPTDLLDSQFAALEPTHGEKDVVEIQVMPSIEHISKQAAEIVSGFCAKHAAKRSV